ncbi:MAG TPA: DUF4395 domain-containing protein [Streptosporangiaceae bacterium]|nr:DUF4395 domain-containing protein [Streptosporangiaceae bacterium]
MGIDPRGPRFGALITAAVLIAVLATGSAWLLGAQAIVFATGAFFGMRCAPYGLIYRYTIRRRLGPPRELEAEAPPRFAQGVGLVFAVVGAIGYAKGVTGLGMAATGFALIAAFLNGAFGICLGCEMYLIIRRIAAGKQVLDAGQN